MQKELFEVQSGPVISAADVVRIGDTQYRQKQVIPETHDIPLFPMPVMAAEEKFSVMDLCLETMVDELELPSFGQKEKGRKLAGGVGAAATRKVKKVSHKTVKACVMSPKGSEDAAVQSAATTTTSQQAPTAQRPTDEAASQKATSPTKSKVYQKRAAKKQNTATDHILQATEQKKQATAESAKTENRATGATFEATQQKTQATRVSMQATTA